MGVFQSIIEKLKNRSPDRPVPKPHSKSGQEVMREMRLEWLDVKRANKSESVSAVLMDWPIGSEVATVCSSSQGDGSLYTTGTFGIIGGIGHAKVKDASALFIRAAEKCLPLSKPVTEYPYSRPDQVNFYFVTSAAVRAISFPLSDVQIEGSPARYLFAHGQKVLTELRLTGVKDGVANQSTDPAP